MSSAASRRSLHESRGINLLSLIALAIGLAGTSVGTRWMNDSIEREARTKFERYATKLEDGIRARFEKARYGFKGLHSHFMATDARVDRAQFRTWVAARQFADDFPGIRGLGFIERVPRSNLPAFLARERADGAPEFRIRTAGDAPDLFVIKFIEPLANNRAAWGYDVGSEAVRRAAAEQAVDTGTLTLTGRIVLVQDGRKRPGYLYYLPVYRPGSHPQTPPQRRAMLVGLIYAPIVLEELLTGVANVTDRQLDYELYDGEAAGADNLVFDLDGHLQRLTPTQRSATIGSTSKGRMFSNERRIDVGGHTLTLHVSTTPAFHAEVNYAAASWFGVGGVMLSALLALTVWLVGHGRQRAHVMAERMTADLNAQKDRAEAALRENKGLLDTLNRYMIVSVTDPSGTIIDVNEAFCQISGYTRDELIGHNHRLLNSGQQSPAFWAHMWKTVAGGHPWSGEVCNRAKDGSLYWVQSIIAPFHGAGGSIEKYISIRSDITASKRIQHELKELAERFALAIDGGSDGLWDWMNVHSHEEWWSPQFYRLLGYEPGEVPPDLVTFDNFLHPEDRAATFAAIDQAFKQARPYDVEYRMRTKNGDYRWFRSRAKVFFDATGAPLRMAGSIQDIHDRRLAQQKILEHSEQLDAIFTLSPDGFVSFDSEGCVTYASPAFARLTGIDAADVVGQDEAGFLARLLDRAVPGSTPSSFDALRERASASGERLILELREPAARMAQIRLQQGHGSVRQVLLLRDVTHETEIDRMKSAFLSMAAHELRTPMTSIYGFTELLLHRRITPEKQADLLGRIHRQSEVMIEIINELLDLSRIEARGGKDFEIRRHELAALVREVVDDFKPPEGRTPPEVALPAGARPVLVDPAKLRQAVLNLLSNAYKYSPQGGAVEIAFVDAERDGAPRFGLRVVDHGIGMTADQLARVGERFYRADKSGNIPGTGLGISIVKEIVELMGGSMHLDSEPGHGTAVTLWLRAA